MLNDKQYIDSFITNNKKYDILTNKKSWSWITKYKQCKKILAKKKKEML